MYARNRIARAAPRHRHTVRPVRDDARTQPLTLLNPQRPPLPSPAPPRTPPTPGVVLPGYFVGGRIGGGGMADVFYGEKIGAGGFRAPVAVKRVRLDPTSDDYATTRAAFAFEAQVTGRLRHPNLVAGRDFIQTGSGDYLVCDFVDGWTLLDALRRASDQRVRLSLGASIGIVASVASGLAEVHKPAPIGPHVLHADISPTNIMVSETGHTTLIDFGVCAPLGQSAPRVQGKLAYMSPEQARGGPLGAQSDIFSLCLLLWELVCWRRLRSKSAHEAARLIEAGNGEVPLLREAGVTKHPLLERIIAEGTHVSAQARQSDAAALADALRDFARKAGLDTTPSRVGKELRTLHTPSSPKATPPKSGTSKE